MIDTPLLVFAPRPTAERWRDLSTTLAEIEHLAHSILIIEQRLKQRRRNAIARAADFERKLDELKLFIDRQISEHQLSLLKTEPRRENRRPTRP